MSKIVKEDNLAVGNEEMPDKCCSFCGANPRDGDDVGFGFLTSTLEDVAICANCIKEAHEHTSKVKSLIEDGFKMALEYQSKGVRETESGDCACVRCCTNRLIAEYHQNKAVLDAAGTKH